MPDAPGPGSGPLQSTLGLKPLDRRWVTLQRVEGWILAAVVLAAALVALAVLGARAGRVWAAGGAAAWVALAACLAWSAHALPVLRYRCSGFSVDDLLIEVRLGWLWRSVTTVPRSRVQHTDLRQGPLMRRLGLAELVIHTAGTRHAVVVVPGLDHARAVALRDHLLGERVDVGP